MIRAIVDRINNRMNFSFKDVHLGIVYPITSKTDVLPGAQNGTIYRHAVPDMTKTSIVYWEDFGGKKILGTARYQQMQQRVRLVVWLNFNKIEEDYDTCIKEILRSIPRQYGTTLIRLVGQVPKDTNIFSRYSYRDQKQYITYPLDVAAFDFDIKYFLTTCDYVPPPPIDDGEEDIDTDVDVDEGDDILDCIIATESLDGIVFTDLEDDTFAFGTYKPMGVYTNANVIDVELDGEMLVFMTDYWFDGDDYLSFSAEWIAEKIADGCIIMTVYLNDIVIPIRYIQICPCDIEDDVDFGGGDDFDDDDVEDDDVDFEDDDDEVCYGVGFWFTWMDGFNYQVGDILTYGPSYLDPGVVPIIYARWRVLTIYGDGSIGTMELLNEGIYTGVTDGNKSLAGGSGLGLVMNIRFDEVPCIPDDEDIDFDEDIDEDET